MNLIEFGGIGGDLKDNLETGGGSGDEADSVLNDLLLNLTTQFPRAHPPTRGYPPPPAVRHSRPRLGPSARGRPSDLEC